MLLLACLWTGDLVGQQDRPFVNFDFSRQNDFTFVTNLDSWYTFKKGRYGLDMKLGHSNIYNTSLTAERFVQVYLRSSIWQHFRIKKNLEVVSWIETDQYFNNPNQKINLYAGLRYQPWSFLSVTPLLGYTWDVRTAVLGQTIAQPKLDQGLTPAVLLQTEYSWPDIKLETTTRMFLRYKDISPRRQYNTFLQHAWQKQFEEGVQLQASIAGGSHELDDYQGNSVKRILSDTLQPTLNLGYTFYKGLEWQSENGMQIFRRRFLFSSLTEGLPDDNNLTFQGLEINTRQRIGIVQPHWRMSGAYHYQYSSRVYDLDNTTNLNPTDYENRLLIEQQKDFMKNLHRVELGLDADIARQHRLSFGLVNQYLQYDTQSETNFDDRDELSYLGSTEWQARWRPRFSTTAGLSANYRHYAFLLKEKSQDNYIQRSLRLEFKFGWDASKRLRIEGDNAVYVTYNVKDFTDYNKTDRSTRNLENNAKMVYRPTQRLQFETAFRRKETQQSYLNWEAFSETTLDTNRIMTVEQRCRLQINAKNTGSVWFVEAGYKHFEQVKRFKATMVGINSGSGPISLRQISRQSGPLLSVGMRDRNQSTLDAGVWLQIQTRLNRFDRLDGNDFYSNIFTETALLERATELRPYMTIRLNYYFGQEAGN
jgi:hypothetical protein